MGRAAPVNTTCRKKRFYNYFLYVCKYSHIVTSRTGIMLKKHRIDNELAYAIKELY